LAAQRRLTERSGVCLRARECDGLRVAAREWLVSVGQELARERMDEAVSSLRLSTDEAGSNTIFTRNESVPNFTIKLTIPGYTAIFYDGMADVAARTKWGTCQEAKFWYWNVEKKGMVCVVTDADLKYVFQQFSETKVACFVVEFAIKPVYKCNIALDFKMEKLPVRRAPDVSHESASSGESDDESVKEEDNVDPALMDDEDIFMEDNEVFVSLGLRAEEVAARKNMEQDGLGLNVDDVFNSKRTFRVCPCAVPRCPLSCAVASSAPCCAVAGGRHDALEAPPALPLASTPASSGSTPGPHRRREPQCRRRHKRRLAAAPRPSSNPNAPGPKLVVLLLRDDGDLLTTMGLMPPLPP
ncbi:hypothetical protein EJB05_02807, partial [Eragrostis curvula]